MIVVITIQSFLARRKQVDYYKSGDNLTADKVRVQLPTLPKTYIYLYEPGLWDKSVNLSRTNSSSDVKIRAVASD